MDGTTGFESFHAHAPKALKSLKGLPELAKAPTEQPAQAEGHVEAVSEMIAKWRKEGLFEPRPVATGLYGLAVLAAIAGSVALAPHYPKVAGLLGGTAWAHCGFLQHMGGHHELGRLSLAWQHLFEGLCKGGSGTWWRNRHNKHHAKTNVLGEDGDLRTTPFFAWDPTLAKKVPNWSLRTQAFTFIPALGAYVFIFAFTVRKYAMVKKLWLEVGLMVAHYALFAVGLQAAGCGVGSALAYYCTGYAFQGIYLGFFFGLSHFAVERLPSNATWLESSMRGTVNWGGASAVCGYVSGFLNVQIEHHMAPQMPMENLRAIRGDCKALAERFGLPYRELSFWGAVKLMVGGLATTGRDELKRRRSYVGAAAAVIGKIHAD
jgi:fatty acid desaturase